MSLESEIVIVSGLPRSGTSLMMQMLHKGGIPAVTDGIRQADHDNPQGYYEFEAVKRTKEDPAWLSDARGKVVKMVSSLLYDLPPTESYRVLFMERDIDEVLASQEKMLVRLGRPVPDSEKMKSAFAVHLKRLFEWLPSQQHLKLIKINYNRLMEDPESICGEVVLFLDDVLSKDQMLAAIDANLYRNRRAS